MSRALDTPLVDQLSAAVVYPAWIFKTTFGTQSLKLWTGSGSLVWEAETYLGNGWFNDFDPSAETGQLSAEGFSITLTSVPPEIISLVLNDAKHNSPGYLYFALLNESGVLYGNPYLSAFGGLDVPEIIESDKESSVRLTYENSLLMLERPRGPRINDQAQKNRFPGDRGFEYVSALKDITLTWGVPTEIPSR